MLESVAPLRVGTESFKIEVELRHSKHVGAGFKNCCANLLMFVTACVNWEALYILEYEAEGIFWFGKSEGVTPRG
jgi:hypothetical protein